MQNNNNQVIKKESFSAFINNSATQKAIQNTLQDSVKSKKFTASIVSAVTKNKQLQQCDYTSILTGALLGESLNLSPSAQLGQYYLVPFGKEAVFIVGYRGLVQLAIRSGMYEALNVMEIREGEYKGLDAKSGEAKIEFIQDDVERLKKKVVGYYAYLKLTSGFEKSLYWSKEKMIEHAKTYVKSLGNSGKEKLDKLANGEKIQITDKDSFWLKDFDQMCCKTLLRQLLSKWGVLSIDLQEAIIKDNTSGLSVADRHYMDAEYRDTDIKSITQEQQAQIKEALAEVKEEPTQPQEQPDNKVNVDDFIKNYNQENNDDVFNNF